MRRKQHYLSYRYMVPLVLVVVIIFGFVMSQRKPEEVIISPAPSKFIAAVLLTPTPIPTSMPIPTPTPRRLTLAEMQAKYGPCAYVPTLMYHHIQTEASAVAKGQRSLSVFTPTFRSQMEYLQAKNYHPIDMRQLETFFDGGAALPGKPVLLTFDDAYGDFYTDAYPILREFGFPATLFVPTGLVENPDYVTWSQIQDMKGSGLVLFANHTWSHHSMKSDPATDLREITTADQQLQDKGLNDPKVFAYPYGGINTASEKDLRDNGYQLAFTTVYGTNLCKVQRLVLPRVRVGNAPLKNYGL